jgi:hypothetical protein
MYAIRYHFPHLLAADVPEQYDAAGLIGRQGNFEVRVGARLDNIEGRLPPVAPTQ